MKISIKARVHMTDVIEYICCVYFTCVYVCVSPLLEE